VILADINYTAIAEWSQVASSILFLGVLIWIWMKFIQPAIIVAQQNQNAKLAEAERHRDDAKSTLDSLQGELGNAQRDAEAIKERVAAQAAAERQAVLREAREAGDRAVRNAAGELARSRAAAREKLRDELLERALVLARAEAEERVDQRVNHELVTSFLGSLEHGGRN
jgi:F0F1-type ATP synthase membrane subunit b/b'